jgi:flavodoxin
MKVGILVHSGTGITRRFAGVLAERLREGGHEAEVVPLEAAGEVRPHQRDVVLERVPDCGGYDAMMIGGPVWAFDMSPVVLSFAGSLRDLAGMRVVPFATMAFPFPFMGGTRAVRRLGALLEKAGATVLPGVILGGRTREEAQTGEEAAGRIESLLESGKPR